MRAVWRQYGQWSGVKIAGTTSFILSGDDQQNHMQRALWLTAMVEGDGLFGSVQSYDGCGMSAGLEHCIGLYPKTMKQGSLWGLLRKVCDSAPEESKQLMSAFGAVGWELGADGILRKNNKVVSGEEIRNVLSPPGGKVPRTGKDWAEAKRWVMLFHNLFSDELTFPVQIESGIDALIKGNRAGEENAYQQSVGESSARDLVVGVSIDEAHDLALCVYHSFSVNAPAIARQVLSLSRPGDKGFPGRLIRLLGAKGWGNWSVRYTRTRNYAMKSGLWDQGLFVGPNAVMPKR
jgi:hypothetical protein